MDLKLSYEENVSRNLCNKQDYNILLCYDYFGRMNGIKRARKALKKMRSDIVSADESPEVTEICPHCKSEITLHWNVKDGVIGLIALCAGKADALFSLSQ